MSEQNLEQYHQQQQNLDSLQSLPDSNNNQQTSNNQKNQQSPQNNNNNNTNQNSLSEQILDGYHKLKHYLTSEFDSKKTFYCLKRLSFLFSSKKLTAKGANIDELINLKIIEIIVSKIKSFEDENIGKHLQNACLWFIANIMALLREDQIQNYIQELPLIDVFYYFLNSEDPSSIEQALWSLANFVSYIPIRDLAIQQGIIQELIFLISRLTDPEQSSFFTIKINRTLTWLISNICRKPSPDFEVMIQFLPYLATMMHSCDNQILRDSCLAIGNMVLSESNTREDDQQQIEEILSYNVGERAMFLVLHRCVEVSMGSLVLLGHLSYGNEIQTQYLLDLGVLDVLEKIIDLNKSVQRKKEALFCLSNIMAGSFNQFQQVIDHGLLLKVLKLAQTTKEQLLLEESMICIMNCTYNMNKTQAQWLIDNKFIFILSGQFKMKQISGHHLTKDLKESILNVISKINEIPQNLEKVLSNVGIDYKKELENYQQSQQQQQQSSNNIINNTSSSGDEQ